MHVCMPHWFFFFFSIDLQQICLHVLLDSTLIIVLGYTLFFFVVVFI